jgi:hypothetical protein
VVGKTFDGERDGLALGSIHSTSVFVATTAAAIASL